MRLLQRRESPGRAPTAGPTIAGRPQVLSLASAEAASLIVMTRFGSSPMLTCCNFQNVRTIRPAPTSSMSASASSLMTMARRSQCALTVAVVRPVALLRDV